MQALPVRPSWSLLSNHSRDLLDEAFGIIDAPSPDLMSQETETCERERRSLLDVVGKDEAWLADRAAESHYAVLTLPLPSSLGLRHQYKASLQPQDPCGHDNETRAAAPSPSSSQPGMAVQTTEIAGAPHKKLTKQDAILIYFLQLGPRDPQKTNNIARHYNISAKAVRDIWTHKSWLAATTPFLPIVHGNLAASTQNHDPASWRTTHRQHLQWTAARMAKEFKREEGGGEGGEDRKARREGV